MHKNIAKLQLKLTVGIKMTVREYTVALSSLLRCFLFVIMGVWMCMYDGVNGIKVSYTQAKLWDGFACRTDITWDFQQSHNIPLDIVRPPGSPWFVAGSRTRCRQGREWRQKWGCRVGLLAQLRRQPHRLALPSIFLTNARSVIHKTEELELQMVGKKHVQDCCVTIITETWLHLLIPDAAVQLSSHSMHRFNRTSSSSKTRGGGLCVHVHQDWCTNSRVIYTHCSPELELITVMCRPFYLSTFHSRLMLAQLSLGYMTP